jgi:hypothetical protein
MCAIFKRKPMLFYPLYQRSRAALLSAPSPFAPFAGWDPTQGGAFGAPPLLPFGALPGIDAIAGFTGLQSGFGSAQSWLPAAPYLRPNPLAPTHSVMSQPGGWGSFDGAATINGPDAFETRGRTSPDFAGLLGAGPSPGASTDLNGFGQTFAHADETNSVSADGSDASASTLSPLPQSLAPSEEEPKRGLLSGLPLDATLLSADPASAEGAGIQEAGGRDTQLAQELFFLFGRPPLWVRPRPQDLTPLDQLGRGSAGGENAGKRFSPSQGKDDPPNVPCDYCRDPTTDEPGPKQKHNDHKIPRSQGGNDDETNRGPACATCNIWKGGRTIDQWYRDIGAPER